MFVGESLFISQKTTSQSRESNLKHKYTFSKCLCKCCGRQTASSLFLLRAKSIVVWPLLFRKHLLECCSRQTASLLLFLRAKSILVWPLLSFMVVDVQCFNNILMTSVFQKEITNWILQSITYCTPIDYLLSWLDSWLYCFLSKIHNSCVISSIILPLPSQELKSLISIPISGSLSPSTLSKTWYFYNLRSLWLYKQVCLVR